MNNQNSILLIDPKFDPSTSANCNLLVKIGMDSFSYAILNKEVNKVMAVFDEQACDDVLKKLNERVKNDIYLGLTFNEVKIAAYTENYIAIPNALYKHEDLPLNTQFFPQSHGGNPIVTAHSNFDFTSVFAYSKLTEEIINESFVDGKKHQQYTALLKLAENKEDTSLFIDFTAGSICILYLAAKQVVFQQCYEVDNTEEFNYYLLLMANQLSINFNETSVYISGIIDQDDKKYNCLKHYFNTIHFLNFEDVNLDQQVLEDMPSHYYTTLLALDQCV